MSPTPAELAEESSATAGSDVNDATPTKRAMTLWSHIPRGTTLDGAEWERRHRVLQWILALHIPALFLMSLLLGRGLALTTYLLMPTVVLVLGSQALKRWRRTAAVLNTSGLTYCSIALVVISGGAIEAHFHFFIMIGLIALYQDWVPLGFNIGLTVISHGLGSALQANLMFNHPAGQQNPWLWAAIHGVAVLVAYAGVVAFWGITEDDQNERVELTRRLTEAKAAQQAAALEDINAVFLNIAHRSQAIVHRQLQVLDKAERAEDDPDQLGLLFQLDHLTTRERRNAENLIILGGGQPGRQWRNPVPLLELVRSAASETEQYTRVALGRMPRMMVAGRAVGDLIHLLAELLDNATSFSPPDARIDVRGNRVGKGVVLEVEDQGLGIEPERMEQLNAMLRSDSSIGPSAKSQDWRLGLFVVSRLARRHGISVTLVESAYGGVRAIALIPMPLLTEAPDEDPGTDLMDDLALAGTAPAPAPAPTPTSNGNGNGKRPRPQPRHSRNGRSVEATVAEEAPAAAVPETSDVQDAPEVPPEGPDAQPAAPSPKPRPALVKRNGSTAPATAPATVAPAPEAKSTPGRPGLPTRKRQAHVAPELRDAPTSTPAEESTEDTAMIEISTVDDDAAAQQARSRMSAFQRGTAGGRSSGADQTNS
jgi:signal transduction histidine kinase